MADRWQCEIYMFQIYVVLEVLDVVFIIYNTLKYILYWRL